MFIHKAKFGWLLLMMSGCSGALELEKISAISMTENTQNLEGDMEVQNPNLIQYNINSKPVHKIVCESLSSTQASDPAYGLKAQLVYRQPHQQRYNRVRDYFKHLTLSDKQLFYKDLNVPTRMFHQGFQTADSSILKTPTGQTLIEFFALRFQSNLVLAPEDDEGTYELAILSDDGSILSLDLGQGLVDIINNDGDHPTRMGCTSQRITLTRGQKIPLEYLYYQGPRFHISNVLMWRKVSQEQEPLCGRSGNHLFFNPDRGSEPQAAYADLLRRGWRPLQEKNFLLHDGSANEYNPCVEAPAPQLSSIEIKLSGESSFTVSWSTDIPATSQVLVKNLQTGEAVVPPSDLVLRTQHRLVVTGLNPSTEYSVQVVSIGEALGRTLSDVFRIEIP